MSELEEELGRKPMRSTESGSSSSAIGDPSRPSRGVATEQSVVEGAASGPTPSVLGCSGMRCVACRAPEDVSTRSARSRGPGKRSSSSGLCRLMGGVRVSCGASCRVNTTVRERSRDAPRALYFRHAGARFLCAPFRAARVSGQVYRAKGCNGRVA